MLSGGEDEPPTHPLPAPQGEQQDIQKAPPAHPALLLKGPPMTDHPTNTLPVRRDDGSFARNNFVEVEPGSWWRLVSTTSSLAGRPAPDHGLVLLVTEARVVDGELHTIVLAGHPLWTNAQNHVSSIKMLVADFLRDFRPDPDGATLREAEIAAALGRVADIGQSIGTPPDEETLLALPKPTSTGKAKTNKTRDAKAGSAPDAAAADPEPRDDVVAMVPSALLPSGDIAAAQARVERQMAILEARKTWTLARTAEMQREMSLVGHYQTEKVAATMATLSDAQGHAKKLLANVTTMRLFLGEEIAVETLIDGESAPESEPLVFLQRLLYLDEEIYAQDLLDGIDARNIADLGKILVEDPRLVERMLPHPRSVVLARIRRNERHRDTNREVSIRAIFDEIAENDMDKRILVLVRDGDKLHLVLADAQTSGAERLFPSAAEIDALFTRGGRWSSEERRSITPDDIDYSDARAAHDARALFYKRFLILFWGLHERLGLFGPFMARDRNWLEETTHSERFVFIHDEENALTDGRPPIRAYLEENRRHIAHGARIVVRWDAAADHRRAPAVYDYDNRNYRDIPKADFVRDIDETLVVRDGHDLVARAEVRRIGWTQKQTTVKARVALAQPTSRRGWDIADGFAVVDRISLEDATYYIESRAAREHYVAYLHAFARVRKIHLAEKPAIDAILDDLVARSGGDVAIARAALRAWRGRNRWKLPESPNALKGLAQTVRDLSSGPTGSASDVVTALRSLAAGRPIQILLAGDGSLVLEEEVPQAVLPGDFEAPWILRRTFRLKGSKLSHLAACEGAREIRPAAWTVEPGEVELWRDTPALEAVLERQRRFPHGLDPEGMAALERRLASGAAAELLDQVAGPRLETVAALLEAIYAAKRSEGNQVILPDAGAPVALLALPEMPNPNGKGHADTPAQAWLISIRLDAESLAVRTGYEDELRRHLRATYASPERRLDRIRENAERPGGVLRPEAHAITGRLPLGQMLAAWKDVVQPDLGGWRDLANQRQPSEPLGLVERMVGALTERSDFPSDWMNAPDAILRVRARAATATLLVDPEIEPRLAALFAAPKPAETPPA